MACLLTAGRSKACKDKIGGLKGIGFINDGDLGTITYGANGDTIASIAGTQHVYYYDLKGGTSSVTSNITSSRDNGTTFFEEKIAVTLPSLSATDHKEIKLLAFGNPKVFIHTNNDEFFLCGTEFGCDVTAGTIVTGAAMGDLTGYTLELTGMERKPFNKFDDTTLAAIATSCNFIFVFGDGTFIS